MYYMIPMAVSLREFVVTDTDILNVIDKTIFL